MAVREFNGTSDNLIQGLGAATSMTFGTAAMLLKFSTVTSFRSLFQFHDSGNTFVFTPLDLSNFGTLQTFYVSGSDSGFSMSTGIWYLVVIRKATGSATPRYSVYNYTGASWSHGNFVGGAEANATATGAGGRSGFAFQGSSDFFGGRVAARAAWANSLPWSADSSGDTALQSSGLKDAASSWLSSSPSVFWLYNQASTGTAVDDVSSGGTGTQISITGTTVVTGDDPAGFDFSLTAGDPATPLVQLQYWPSLRGGRWPRLQLAQSGLFVPPGTNAPADVATAVGTAPFDPSGGSISLNLIADNPVDAVGTAYDATISTAPSTNAPAGLASGTGTANNATVKVSPTPTAATATGTANNPTVQTGSFTNAPAGAATATGTANNATVKVAPGSGIATATGAAQGATGAVSPGPAAATGTGTAQNTTSKVATGPSTATATGVANNAVVNTGGNVNVAAGLASATGTAFNATVTRTANAQAGVASATGSVPLVSMRIAAQIQAAQALAEAFGVIPNQVLVGTAHAATGTAPTASAVTGAAPGASAGSMTVPISTGA